MNKLFVKKTFALIMAVSIVILGTLCVNAVEIQEISDNTQKYTCVLDETIEINDNEVYFCTYNITKNNNWGIKYQFDSDIEDIVVWAKDCVEKPYRMEALADVKYKLYMTSKHSSSGYTTHEYSNTGGTYRKVRFKLSDNDYFNADGSRTKKDHDYYFGDDEYEGKNEYSSALIIYSGACINFVAPDKDGFVEFYVSTDIEKGVRFSTDFHSKVYTESSVTTSGGGGTDGRYIVQFTKGAVEGRSSVYISDATLIQKYASRAIEFDELQKFRADVDCDNAVNVLDATKIQKYLAKTDI